MLRKHWPFMAALGLQLVLLAAVPAKKIHARLTGTPIALMTRPVDPYDALAGYYVTLAYQVERVPPEFRPKGLSRGTSVWLELAPAEPAWRLVAVHGRVPAVADGHAVIKGVWRRSEADLPEASRLYIPEDDRHTVADALRAAGGRGIVDLRVTRQGTPIVVRLRVGGRTFGG